MKNEQKRCFLVTPYLAAIFTIGLVAVTTFTNPTAYAILGLPDNFNNNNNDNNNTSTEEQITQAQTINGFSLYQNDMFGFTVQYPSEWRIDERNYQQPSYQDPNNQNPVLNANNIVNFYSANKSQSGSVESSIQISYLPLGKYLDTNDLKVKSKTAHDYVVDSMNYMTSYDPTKFIQYKIIRDKPATIGVNHYPAWRLDYTSTALGSTSYVVDIFSIIGDKVFKFSTDADPLQIPSYLPIFQKTIDSFQIH